MISTILFGVMVACVSTYVYSKNSVEEDHKNKKINVVLKHTGLKRSFKENGEEKEYVANCYKVIDQDDKIDYYINLPLNKSHKDLTNALPIINSHMGFKSSKVVLKGDNVISDIIISVPKKNEVIPFVTDINKIFKMNAFKNLDDEFAFVSDVKEYDTYADVFVEIPIGKAYDDLDKCTEAIAAFYKNDVQAFDREGVFGYKVYTTRLKPIYNYEFIKTDSSNGFSVCVGNSRDGNLIFNLSENDHHMLISGAQGSGKSNFTNALLCNILENYSEKEVELVLIDMKATEFNDYKKCKQVVFHSTDPGESVDFIKNIRHEIKERNVKLAEYGCREIRDYNRKNKDDIMPYKLVVIEECVEFGSYQNQFKKDLEIGLSQARSAGVHFILTTQRNVASILDTNISIHLALRVAFKATTPQESKNIIETPIAYKIQNKGQGICMYKGSYERFQAFRIEDGQIVSITKKNARKGKETNKNSNCSRGYDEIVKKATAHALNVKQKELEGEGGI